MSLSVESAPRPRSLSISSDEGSLIEVQLSPSMADAPQSELRATPQQPIGLLKIITGEDKPVKRRATFSIPTGEQTNTLGLESHANGDKDHLITTLPGDKNDAFLDVPYPDADDESRRDSGVCMNDSSEDEYKASPQSKRQSYLKDSNLITPIATPLREGFDPFVLPDPKDFEINVPEVAKAPVDDDERLEQDKDEIQHVVEGMNKDDVLVYQSDMNQIASVFLPKELKSTVELPHEAADRIEITKKEDVVVCVIGVGYVGAELLTAFGGVYTSIGYDVSQARIDFIAPEYKHLPNVSLTNDVSQLARGTHYLISVPTNLHKDNSVNATHLLTAISTVANYARPGSVVVIESSVSVGMTRAFLSKYSSTLHCGMSPERVDPGRVSPTLIEIPKIVSGLDQVSLSKIKAVYSEVFDNVVAVSRPEVAEMTKLYENCFRMVNIAYINEIADACTKQGIDPHEVIDAASTKPFGFMPFRPGLGVGGHCIPVNPHYLFVNNDLPMLAFASQRMKDRPAKLARELFNEVSAELKTKFSKSLSSSPRRSHNRRASEPPSPVSLSSSEDNASPIATLPPPSSLNPRLLIIGVAFKPGQNVISCSPGLSFASALSEMGCSKLMFYDPMVAQGAAPWMRRLSSKKFTKKYIESHFDVVAVCLRQHGVDWDVLKTLETTRVKYFYNELR